MVLFWEFQPGEAHFFDKQNIHSHEQTMNLQGNTNHNWRCPTAGAPCSSTSIVRAVNQLKLSGAMTCVARNETTPLPTSFDQVPAYNTEMVRPLTPPPVQRDIRWDFFAYSSPARQRATEARHAQFPASHYA